MSCGEGRGLLVLHHIGVGGVGAQLGPRGDVSGVFVMKKTRFPETFTLSALLGLSPLYLHPQYT